MSLYLLIKTLHILSATLIMGTGLGTAFYLFVANRSDSVPAQAVVSKWVCKADWWFTTPAVIFQPLSGLWMAHYLGMPFSATWIWMSLALFVFAGIFWLPVVFWQIQMRDMAQHTQQRGSNKLPAKYWRLARRWEMAGYPAFSAVVIIFFLMVIKPM
ncbi:DUF2269 family protein [Psychrobacter sp. FDAARGOS_221]|uniref:DUF2269 family protein n=1 Tax=Psychrobacter sp. FDAARGOS_221 TaxID=1975705 RepID=UPI000BB56928|nr:DUF2269 domain-containing protein [Psychrobacter sp. FDAARGOS_221]PNK60742.1 DUF2269 domain-containing protein [Psychrobacter sp. FDAARGOS_221]